MALVGTMTLGGVGVDLGHVARRVSSQRLRVVGGEHPVAVLGDADRHDVVAVAVDAPRSTLGGGRAGDRVLGGAAAEDEGDAGAAGAAVGVGPGRARRCSSPATLSLAAGVR